MKNKSSSVVGCYRNFNPPWGVVVVIDGLGHLFGLHPTRSDAGNRRRRGDAILRRVEERLGDKFKGLFETADVPYTMYQIFKGKDIIGYIHGVNQKGQYGGVQVVLALDIEGNIRAFYFQKLTNQYAKLLLDREFGKQFIGLNLKDFNDYDIVTGQAKAGSRMAAIKNPAPKAEEDFRAALRAAKKNLILCDEFLLGNKYLK